MWKDIFKKLSVRMDIGFSRDRISWRAYLNAVIFLFINPLKPKLDECLRIQSVLQRKHNTSPLQRSTC
jgi:hypothetical protein